LDIAVPMALDQFFEIAMLQSPSSQEDHRQPDQGDRSFETIA
jgi:hypothetical protein